MAKLFSKIKPIIRKRLDPGDLLYDEWRCDSGFLDRKAAKLRSRILLSRVVNFSIALCSLPLVLWRFICFQKNLFMEFETLHFSQKRKIVMGKRCIVDKQTWLINGRNIHMGNYVKISAFSCLMAGLNSTITIGTNTIISAGVIIVTFNHGYQNSNVPIRYQEYIDTPKGSIEIGNNVWIGAQAVILPGARIGEGAIIGAGSIVKGVVPPFSTFTTKCENNIKIRQPEGSPCG
jgi:acetyltransferase-like isoleucine patch superfamily enzyme